MNATTHPLVLPRSQPAEIWQARLLFAFLAVQFIVPAISYLATPHLALETLDQVNRLLGGGAYLATESTGHVWHMLAVGNVMTLGFMCGLLAADPRRFFPVLPALAFLKGFSALFSLGLALTGRPPLFFAVFLLDGSTTVAMVVFGLRARRAWRRLEGAAEVTWWQSLLLVDVERIERSIALARRAGLVDRPVTPAQIAKGIARMWGRVMFRSDTIGTSTDPVRPNWRARCLQFRPLRFPFLLAERVIAPLDFSGLLSSPERISRHVLGAHHQRIQVIYDLELLSMHEGALDELQRALEALVAHDTPRTRWLRDLCVFERYHEQVLETLKAWRAGTLALTEAQRTDPDLTLTGYLSWCARA